MRPGSFSNSRRMSNDMNAIPPQKFSLKVQDYIDTPEGKKTFNEEHFNEAARHYDFATRAMSLGRDRAWKRQLVNALPEVIDPVCVDLACGTGDISFMVAEKYPRGQVVGIDLAAAMLDLARKRSRSDRVEFRQGDMGALDLPDGSADIVTGGYAVRNAADLTQALCEIHRILKPGGTLALLDFSKPASRQLQQLQYLILKYWCGLWGLLLHGNPEVHSYIAASLRTYPDRAALHHLAIDTGFHICLSRRFYLGTLELLVLQKKKA